MSSFGPRSIERAALALPLTSFLGFPLYVMSRPNGAVVRTAGSEGACGAGREFATHSTAKVGTLSSIFAFTWTAPA